MEAAAAGGMGSMHEKAQTGTSTGPRRAISATGQPRSQLARLAARLPQPTTMPRTIGIRPVAAKAVGSYVPRLTRPAFEKYGFSAATLITDWATIVGADIARYTAPERLKWPRRVETAGEEVGDADRGRPGATLILGVAEGRALDIQYKARQLTERINAYFGYAAIADLRIVQIASTGAARGREGAPLLAPSGAKTDAPATPLAELSGIADQGLRAALERMAAGLVSRKGRRAVSA